MTLDQREERGWARLSGKSPFGTDLEQDFSSWWEILEQRGWLVWKNDQPKLVGEGVFYTEAFWRGYNDGVYGRGFVAPV